ncbi:hypothetical protein HanRHA438_Chr17g0804071 [Helianthus annuus]|uniref:Uncharacterized protein n=1 Tax=Helianthus annuus TaxID=4232 RepID=A0A251RN99_HELAN|nr:hypothetical protein HanXRQr2_Chr17g0793941 [Helianthus annuus]KAJ0812429.1 hypothetical protein HanPSC8_Chr17g0761941 [Helianthus annuus]KAJ0825514.1 hypothetical protein HanRHA438_Chr17g0804071 [Helianthus annuus]
MRAFHELNATKVHDKETCIIQCGLSNGISISYKVLQMVWEMLEKMSFLGLLLSLRSQY